MAPQPELGEVRGISEEVSNLVMGAVVARRKTEIHRSDALQGEAIGGVPG